MNRLNQSEWEKLRERVLENHNHQCINCASGQRLEVHHIVPLSAGGTNEVPNLIPLCKPCHLRAEGKQIRNEPVSQKDIKTYTKLVTPHEARGLLASLNHPLWRTIVILFTYYGIGVGEASNLKLKDYVTSDLSVASEFDIEYSENPVLKIVPDRKRASTRSRAYTTTLPLLPKIEFEIIRYLLIRPDSDSSNIFLSTNSWGEPTTGDMITHSVEDSSSKRPQAFINCFKKYAPINQYIKRYLLTGDEEELQNGMSELDEETGPKRYLRNQYYSHIYNLHNSPR